jgi:hypothetical protein
MPACAEPALAVATTARTRRRSAALDAASTFASLTVGSLPHEVGAQELERGRDLPGSIAPGNRAAHGAWILMLVLVFAVAPAIVVTLTAKTWRPTESRLE